MPWMYPNSPDSYLRLIKAIDRPQFAVHLDIVNIIDTPEKYYRNDIFIIECFSKLGKYIKSCHLKDTLLDPKYTVHINEVRPGLGEFNYSVFFNELRKAGPEIPCMLEHLPNQKEYSLAADHIRKF